MKAAFFQQIVELYKASNTEKQQEIVTELVKCGNPESFLKFLNNRLASKNIQFQPTFSLSIDYCLEMGTKFKQETLNGFVDFFIRLLEQHPNPTSFTKFSKFLVSVFANVDSYDTDKMFNILKDLPADLSILPLSYFASQNKQYLQHVFDKAIQTKPADESSAILLYCQATSILFKCAKDNVTYDKDTVYKRTEDFLKHKSLTLTQKFTLFNAALVFLDRDTCNNMINTHYKKLCLEIDSSSKNEDFAEALNASAAVLSHIKAETVIDPCLVYDTLFNQILIYYRPSDIIDSSLVNACSVIEPESLKFLLNPFIAANVNPNCAYFIISHFPHDDYIKYLIGIDTGLSITVPQYRQILYYLNNHDVKSTYIPHLFKILTVSDMPCLDPILDRSPHMYCTAAAKYLATSDDKAKIEYIANALSKRKMLPFIRSRQLPNAFVNVAIQTLQGEAATFPFAVIMEYLYACCSCIEDENDESEMVTFQNKFSRKTKKLHHEYEEDEEEKSPLTPKQQEKTSQPEEETPKQQENPQNEEEKPKNEENQEETKSDNGEVKSDKNNDNEEEENQNNNEEEEQKDKEPKSDKPQDEENKSDNEKSKSDKLQEEPKSDNEEVKSDKTQDEENKVSDENKGDKPVMMRKDFSTALLFTIGDSAAKDLPLDFFDVSTVKCESLSPANLVYNIVQRLNDFSTTLTNMVLDGIREGKSQNCIMIAAISGDQQLLNQCVQVLSETPSMLIHFFTVCCCVSPRIAVEEMVRYYSKVEKKQTLFIFNKTVLNTDEIRLETVLHSLISMSPFIQITEQILDLLRMTFEHSNGSFLSFEAINSICKRSKKTYDVENLIDLMLKFSENVDSKTFIDSLCSVLKISKNISQEIAEKVSKVWMKLLITEKISPSKDCEFEKTFLQARFREVTLIPFLTKLEQSFIKHEDCLLLYDSLERIIRMKEIKSKYLQRYITLCISNSLSSNKEIRKFCIKTLKKFVKLNETISLEITNNFTTDTIDATRPFYDELASKFDINTRILLAEAVMKHFMECLKTNRVSILIFLDCLINLDKNNEVFMSKTKFFVVNLMKMSQFLEFKSPLASLHCNILYTLACNSPNSFFDQVLETNADSLYMRLFLERYYNEPTFSRAFSHFVYYKVEEIVMKNDEFLMLKLLMFLERNIVKNIYLYTDPNEISSFLFTLFLILSDLYNARSSRKTPNEVQEMLTVLFQICQKFYKNTTVSLQKNQFDFTCEEKYSNCLSDFVSQFSRLPNPTVSLFVNKIFGLANNKAHSSNAGIVFAYLLASYSQAYSKESQKLLTEYLGMFFSFLKEGKANDPKIVSSLMSAIILFTPTSFRTLDLHQIQRLLNVTLETAKMNPQKALKVINLIVSSSDSKAIETSLGSIVGTIRVLVENKMNEKECFSLLRSVLKVRKQAEWFIKDSPISFNKMTQIVVLNRDEDVEAILMMLLDCKEFNTDEIYTQMTGLYAAVEQSYSHYIKMCENVLSKVDPAKINSHQMNLLKSIIIPLCSVGDGSADMILDRFTQFITVAMEKNSNSG
ncbi:protein CBG23787 family, partial [Trichomonas vaginalis G3]